MVDSNIGINGERMNKKLDIFIQALQDVICEANEELLKIDNNSSIWTRELIVDTIRPEVTKLLKYANDGEMYFEFGKKQRRLQSTYFVLENIDYQENSLSRKILVLQKIYNKL